ncbi:MAG: Rrf2 family transcriptional regulator [Thermodesulfobacteriota bacterium]
MNVTRRTMYGLQAAVDIAAHQAEGPVKLREISARLGRSKPFLGQILAALNFSGILETRRGPHGGYLLRRSATEITLFDILSITEGPMRLVPCVGTPGGADEACPFAGRCPAGPVWADIHDQMLNLFRGVTLHDLCG